MPPHEAGMSAPSNNARLPRPLIVGVVAVLLASSGIAGLTAWVPTPAAAAIAEPADDSAPVARNCPQCGVVTATRAIGQSGSDAAAGNRASGSRREITVRMNDGSQRTLIHTTTATWRTGERLILIEGDSNVPH